MSNSESEAGLKNLTLITGGARSGKSRLAESLARQSENPVIYIATMQEVETDSEAVSRIAQHKRRRPEEWQTREVPFQLADELRKLPQGPLTCLIDCLSLYVSNRLLTFENPNDHLDDLHDVLEKEAAEIIGAIRERADLGFILVTNEVGSGIVPENALARVYRDMLGWTNQSFAQAASTVYLMCSGIRLKMK